MHKLRLMAAGLVLYSGLVLAPAFAGQTCEPYTPTAAQMSKSASLAAKSAEVMAQLGKKAYIVGRVGQDLSEYGLTYSHLGVAVLNSEGRGFDVYHLLNACGTAESGIFLQGLLEFYSDDLYKYQGALIPLPDEVALRLTKQLQERPKAFHQKHYSLTAYPYSSKYQNSNQWLLESLAGAMSGEVTLENREQAQNWLKAEGFQPTILKIGAFKRLGGRMFKAQVAFDDHPDSLRYADQIHTTTAESIFEFLKNRYPQDSALIEMSITP